MKRYASLFVGLLFASALSGCPGEKDPGAQPKGDPAGTKPATADQPQGPAVAAKPAKQIAEVEPNEKTDQAMELKEACVVKAKLEAAGAKGKRAADWYKIITGAKKVLSIQLSGIPEEDLRLVFRDADRNELFLVDSGGKGEGERYPNLTVSDAVYLKVDGAKGGAGGDYSLTVTMADPQDGDEVEYNGRYSTANDLDLGAKVKGYLGHGRDEDWYLLKLKELPTGAVLRIDLTAVEGVRYNLVVADQEERRPLLKAESTKAGEGLVVRNMGVPAGSEAVYLQVSSAWVPGPKPKKFVRTHNAEVPYTLSVSSEAGGDDLEREPNDDAAHALPLADGQKMRGYLSHPDDDDWYKIDVERPSLLSAKLGGLNRVDLQLYVVDPAKKDDKRNFDLLRINDGKVNEEEVLTNCALAPGENYLLINGAYKKVDGKWVREYHNLDETYELSIALRTDEGREEREPNGKTDLATAIAVGDTMRGTLHPKGDVDTYKLDLSGQDGPVTTTIECSGIPKVDIKLQLLGPEMGEDGKHKQVDASAKGKDEEKEMITKELMPGEYWVVVSGPRFGESNTADQYVLTVTQ